MAVSDIGDTSAFDKIRQTSERQWTVVNSYKTEKGDFREKTMPALQSTGLCFGLPCEGNGKKGKRRGNVVKVGIDDFARKLVGRIDAVKFPKVGSQVAQGEKAWSLLVGTKSIDMLSPVDGKVVAVNENLMSSPESISKDPYGQSWLLKVQAPKISSNLKNLLSGGLAGKWMDGVRENLIARMDYSLGAVSQDGGVPVDGIVRSLDRDRWDAMVNEFFLVS